MYPALYDNLVHLGVSRPDVSVVSSVRRLFSVSKQRSEYYSTLPRVRVLRLHQVHSIQRGCISLVSIRPESVAINVTSNSYFEV